MKKLLLLLTLVGFVTGCDTTAQSENRFQLMQSNRLSSGRIDIRVVRDSWNPKNECYLIYDSQSSDVTFLGMVPCWKNTTGVER